MSDLAAAPHRRQPAARHLADGRRRRRGGARRQGRARPGHRDRARADRRGRRSGCRSSSIRMVAAHTPTARTRDSPPAACRCCQAGPALRHVGGVVRALTPGPLDPPAAYVARIGGARPGHRPRRPSPPAAPAPADRRSGAAPRGSTCPTRCSAARATSPTCAPRACCTDGCCARRRPAPGWCELATDWKATGVELVRDGSFVGVVGEREVDVDRGARAARAATAPGTSATRCPTRTTSPPGSAPARTRRSRSSTRSLGAGHAHRVVLQAVPGSTPRSRRAAGMARWDGDGLHVWSHSQGIHALRAAIAAALGLDPDVGGGRARRERRLLRPQRRRRRGVRRGAAGPRRARAARCWRAGPGPTS